MREAEAEGARGRMLDLAPGGFEEIATGGDLELVAYGDASTEAALRSAFGEIAVRAVEQGWEERWRAFHRPVRAGGLWIGPPWEDSAADEERAVVIDPGRAFGTGAHATTRASIELLAGLQRGSVLDAGCGSGVVAIAAAKLGFEPVAAVDLDPVAVGVARENVRRNGVSVDVRVADVLGDELPAADVVVANIELSAVESVLAALVGAGATAAPGGGAARRAIVSGYLARDRLRAPGWRRIARVQLEGWAADSLVRA